MERNITAIPRPRESAALLRRFLPARAAALNASYSSSAI
jgi:hypothetical protein